MAQYFILRSLILSWPTDIVAFVRTLCKMATRTLGALIFLSLLCLATANNVVDLGYAKYRGNLTFSDTVAFLGLPYAEPPLADLRWRAPLPLDTKRVASEAHGRVIDATEYPDFCVQGTTGGEKNLCFVGCLIFTYCNSCRWRRWWGRFGRLSEG